MPKKVLSQSLEVCSGQIKATSHDGFLPDVRTVSEFSFFQ